jgi:hypothetical protein
MTMIIIIDIVLFFILAKTLIDISLFSAILKKNPEVIKSPNNKIKNYEFIKGLF